MVQFAVMLRSKLNKGSYDFISSVNLLLYRSVAYYNSVDGFSRDDYLFGVVRLLWKQLMDSIEERKKNGQISDQLAQ